MTTMKRISLVLAVLSSLSSCWARTLWIPQTIGNPFEGQYTAITWADINNDGHVDLLVSAGKHWVDQSYVLLNLGPSMSSYYGIRFSDPLPLGPAGAYYAIQVGRFSFGQGVLLAGADCTTDVPNDLGSCTPGTSSPAVLLQVSADTACSANRPRVPCRLDWNIIWQDATHQGDRNGALAYDLGNGVDPALVLVGVGGIKVFEPPYDTAAVEPTFVIQPQDKSPQMNDAVNRGTGLAVGRIGQDYTGFYVGTRTTNSAPPAPIVGVWKTGPTAYDWYNLGNANNAYYGNPQQVAVQATGLVLVDLNQDGIPDLVEANHVSGLQLVDDIPIQQDYYILNQHGFGSPETFAWERTGGRSVDAGPLFADRGGPDVVLGTSNGEIVWFANLGNDAQGNFRGLEERYRVVTESDCEVRSVKIVPNMVRSCAPSVVAAVYCHLDPSSGGVFAYHDALTACPTASTEPPPTASRTTQAPTTTIPTSSPTQSPDGEDTADDSGEQGSQGEIDHEGKEGEWNQGGGTDRAVGSLVSRAPAQPWRLVPLPAGLLLLLLLTIG